LSGEGPFVGENVPSILFQIVHEPPPPLLLKVPGLQRGVEAVLLRALAKDKNDRFPSVGDFATALAAASTGVASVAQSTHEPTALLPCQTALDFVPEKSVVPVTTFTQTAGELEVELDVAPSSSKRWIWGLAAGVVVAGLLVAFLLLRPSPVSKPVMSSPPPEAPSPVVAVPPVVPSAALAAPAAIPPSEAPQDEPQDHFQVADKKAPTGKPAKVIPVPEAKKSSPTPANSSAKKHSPSKKSVEENEELWH
jgi:serine/threonine-protein kinase